MLQRGRHDVDTAADHPKTNLVLSIAQVALNEATTKYERMNLNPLASSRVGREGSVIICKGTLEEDIMY